MASCELRPLLTKKKHLDQLPFTSELWGFSDHVQKAFQDFCFFFSILAQQVRCGQRGCSASHLNRPFLSIWSGVPQFLFAVWQGLKYPTVIKACSIARDIALRDSLCPLCAVCACCHQYIAHVPIVFKSCLKTEQYKRLGLKHQAASWTVQHMWMTAHSCSDKQHRTKQSCQSKHERD